MQCILIMFLGSWGPQTTLTAGVILGKAVIKNSKPCIFLPDRPNNPDTSDHTGWCGNETLVKYFKVGFL